MEISKCCTVLADKDAAMINILISRTTQQYEEFEDEAVNRGELEDQSEKYIVIIPVVLTSVALAICLVIAMIIKHRRCELFIFNNRSRQLSK